MSDPKKNNKSEPDQTEVAESDTLKIRLKEAKASSPVLVVISGKPLGKSFFIAQEKMIVGRELTAEISLSENAVSRKHSEISSTPEGILIKDLGSTNGTFVNDQKIESKILEDGDLVRIGNTILKFLEEGKIENIHYGKMYDLATRDDMTGALNKKAIMDTLSEEFERANTGGFPMSLLFFDIDHFKKINDTFGHLAGDYVLKETCSLIMNKMIRQKDALGRYGGEEFALLLRETPLQIAVDVAERIRNTIEKHEYKFEDKIIPVTISIGVVTRDSTTKSTDDLLSLADKALYTAKHEGRNCVRAR